MASEINTQYNKSKQEVSAMIKQGFISQSFLSSPPSRSPMSSSPGYFSPTRPGSGRANPTLFEMMSEEQAVRQPLENRMKVQERVSRVLAEAPFGDYGGIGDVKLTISGADGVSVSMDVHRRVLVDRSRFFAEKLQSSESLAHSVEICDCDDVEVYVETVVLMYVDDLKRRLMREQVSRVLGLLKVSSALMFDAGVISCLEYLEAVPWSEEEEEKLISHLIELQLDSSISEVLQRVSADPSIYSRTDDIITKLLENILEAKDEKSRRHMKILLSKLLKEDNSKFNHIDISQETLYNISHKCISSLTETLSEATCIDETNGDRGFLMAEIAREADNTQWVVDILIDRKIGDEFVRLWANQKELVALHSKVPIIYRHEISRITAQICVAIGRGRILVPKEIRCLLLSTWLDALYDDFGWMRRSCRSIDKKLIEDGLGQTILTLPLAQQQAILMNWFDRFLDKGDDCPNIQRAFEVWWRRAFVRQYADESHMQIMVCDYPN
jgi:hypothetical protein